MTDIEKLSRMSVLQKRLAVLNDKAAAHWIALTDHIQLEQRRLSTRMRKLVKARWAASKKAA